MWTNPRQFSDAYRCVGGPRDGERISMLAHNTEFLAVDRKDGTDEPPAQTTYRLMGLVQDQRGDWIKVWAEDGLGLFDVLVRLAANYRQKQVVSAAVTMAWTGLCIGGPRDGERVRVADGVDTFDAAAFPSTDGLSELTADPREPGGIRKVTYERMILATSATVDRPLAVWVARPMTAADVVRRLVADYRERVDGPPGSGIIPRTN
ncbi:MAG: hypothetical protein ACK53W_12530 [Gemmatimonadota bacterium]